MLKAIQDRPLIKFEDQKQILDRPIDEPEIEYPDQSSDDEEITTDQTEPVIYHKIGKNNFMEIRPIRNISDLNNEKLEKLC